MKHWFPRYIIALTLLKFLFRPLGDRLVPFLFNLYKVF